MENLKEVVDVICAEYHGYSKDWKENMYTGWLHGVRIYFPNGIAADVAIAEKSNPMFCYDGFEIAVMRNGEIVYDTPITDNVLNVVDLDGLYQTLHDIGEYDLSLE